METIRLALERARSEQTAGGFGRAPDLLAVSSPQPYRPLDAIRYEQTRIVPVDRDHLTRQRIVALDKGTPASVGVDLLRTRVLRTMDENGWRTLAVTSPTEGAGKTVVAVNLAISIAQQTDRTALLVDFDLRRPRVAQYLGTARPGDTSLNDVLSGGAEMPAALVNPGVPRLVCLAAGRAEEMPAEQLASLRTAELIAELRERYPERIVVFDLPPVLRPDDAMAVLPRIDCVLMVVGNGMSKKAEIESSLRQVAASNLLGVVLNRAEPSGGLR